MSGAYEYTYYSKAYCPTSTVAADCLLLSSEGSS